MTSNTVRTSRLQSIWWIVAFTGLVLLVIDRFDLFDVWRSVELPDGSVTSLANGWYTVDHPFHISRAHILLDALRNGEFLRWFGEHQGGYPAEFYPTGAAWIDTAIWAVTFGSLPIEVVHKLLIALIVLAPAFIFLWWAKRDHLSPGVALLAGAGHLVIAGEWWSGGWTEVVLWGLVTNVAAQTAILGAVAGMHGWLARGHSRDLGWSVLFTGLALGINPRTALGLAAIGVAALIVALSPAHSVSFGTALRRGLVLAGLGFAAAAPALLALIRYRDLYYFVHYEEYADVAAWWESSQRALWTPLFWLAMAGMVCGLTRADRPLVRVIALAAGIYMAGTAVMVASNVGPIEQLELTRLMPFQRMLLFYLAAIAVHDGIEMTLRLYGRSCRPHAPGSGRSVADDDSATVPLSNHRSTRLASGRRAFLTANTATGALLSLFALGLVFNVVIDPASWVPEDQRGLRPMGSSAQPATIDLQRAVERADVAAPDGTAILVLGSVLSWHQGLTSPLWSDRRFFYDDWLWYWQRDHVGPYNPETEHAYPRDVDTLTATYLTTHGIGAVIVTDVMGQTNREVASSSPLLELVQTGLWFDVYLVLDPIAIVTVNGQAPQTIVIENHSIGASGTSAGGTAVIRHNWHPRWRATVNGSPVSVVKRADGYMDVEIPAGAYNLRLDYRLTGLDWLARALFTLAALAALILIVGWPKRLPGSRFIARA